MVIQNPHEQPLPSLAKAVSYNTVILSAISLHPTGKDWFASHDSLASVVVDEPWGGLSQTIARVGKESRF